MTVRATRKLLDRVGLGEASDAESTTLLGDWYATALPWRPRQVALLMSDQTLLPVAMPLAPAATLLARFPDHLAEMLTALRVPADVIEHEVAEMQSSTLTTTNNRSRVGSLNEFVFLADTHREPRADVDLLDLSLRLSRVPCSPLYKRHISPDRELAALFAQ
jgi:hypothetical protein